MNGTSCTGTSDDEFADSKSHYNPNNCPHPYHAGDLPPLIECNGYAYMSVLLDRFELNDIIGKVLIIHESQMTLLVSLVEILAKKLLVVK